MKKPIRTMLSIQATPDIANIRTAELLNQEHTVIPCIALVEGVLWPANAPGPELALAEEFGRFPQGWNGRPVTYDHPKIDGHPVSASSPDVLKDNAFGQLFNTELKDGKLHTEIWINEARIAELGDDAQTVIEGLKDGSGVAEVSTGLFTMSEPVGGEFDGREYESVWRNIVPDHLAVLPEGITGACSVADGCGAPRLNQSKETGPEDANEWLPVMRAAQMCTESADKEITGDENVGIFKKLLDLGANIFNFKGNSTGVSDNDMRTAIYAGLRSESEEYFYILAVYPSSPTTGTFVYEMGWDGKLYENTFSVSEGGSISLGSDPMQVRPQTTFVPVQITANSNSNEQENAMNEELVNDLIANEGTQYNEDDREWLSTLEEDQLNKMTPAVVETPAVVKEPAVAAAAAAAGAAAPAKAITTNEYIADAPEEIRALLESSLAMHRARKDVLVTGLLANARCRFTEDQLRAKQVDELESIAALTNDVTFEVNAIDTSVPVTNEGEEAFTPAPNVFEIKTG